MTALTVIVLLAGLLLIILGADWLVDGAGGIARKAGVSEFVIGLTIVGFGTSCPELVVSLTGAIEGLSDVAIGNVVGSNIFNGMLILGLTAIIAPVTVTASNKRRDIPLVLLFTLMLIGAGLWGNDISRIEGVLFLLIFSIYLWYSFRNSGCDGDAAADGKQMGLGKAIFLTLIGLAGLIGGGRMFVNSAVDIAHALGVSEKVIALTLLAGGTSLPELITSVVAALKHRSQLALGNILGSNVFNILLILGCSSVITPLSFSSIDVADMIVLVLSSILMMAAGIIGKGRIGRGYGVLFCLVWVAYIAYLLTI